MGNNQAFTDFEALVIEIYNGCGLDKELLAKIMEQYRGTDIDLGGMVGTVSNDGLDIEEIVVKTLGELPPKPIPPDEVYWESIYELFKEITDGFGWV